MASARVITTSSAPDPNSIPLPDAPHENTWYNGRDFDGYRITEKPLFTRRPIKLICVGAGAGGLQVAYKAERLLRDVEVVIYEKNDDIGGTWLENRYPGCTCDIPSHSYQFTWARNNKWSEFYSGAEEIWRYFKDVAEKFGLEKYVRFNTAVRSATWDDADGVWRLVIERKDGTTFEDSCEVLANCSGVLKWV